MSAGETLEGGREIVEMNLVVAFDKYIHRPLKILALAIHDSSTGSKFSP